MYEIELEGFVFGKNIELRDRLFVTYHKSYSYLFDAITEYVPDCIRIKFPAFYITNKEKWLFLNLKTKINFNSYIYKFSLNNDLDPVDEGSILDIDYPKPLDKFFLGPEDSRLIEFNNVIYLVPTMLTNDRKMRIHLINSSTRGFVELNCRDKELQTTERNWSPFVHKNELYFVYSIDPLRILKYISYGQCEFVYGINPPEDFNSDKEMLRGGTQFQLYQYPYFVGFCRTAYLTTDYGNYPIKIPTGIHKIFLIVMRANPFRIVYIGGPIIIPPDIIMHELSNMHVSIIDNMPLLHLYKNVLFQYLNSREYDVVNDPTSFGFEDNNNNNIYLGVDINAFSCILLGISGLNRVLKEIIELDEDFNNLSNYQDKSESNYPVQQQAKKCMDKFIKEHMFKYFKGWVS